MTTGLFGFRAVAEAVDLNPRQVVAMVRSGQGDRLVGMAFNRKSKLNGWERFIRSATEIGFDPDWDEFIRSATKIG